MRGAIIVGVVAFVAYLEACYTPQLTECKVQCAASSDCGGGQVCGSDGWCAMPANAGRCAQVTAAIDAPAVVHDSPAPKPDADLCAIACTKGTCDRGTCVIDCSAPNACDSDITCPAGVPCRVTCGDKACAHHITCPATQPCDVECSGSQSCGDVINCGAAACTVSCTGYQSCHHHTACPNACACDVTCSGAMSCGDLSMCPSGAACALGRGCTSLIAGCNTCTM